MSEFWEGVTKTQKALGLLAALVALTITLAGIVVPAVLFWNASAPLPGRVAELEEHQRQDSVLHAEEQEVFGTILFNQQAFVPQVEKLLEDAQYSKCSRNLLDSSRDVDTILVECRPEWQRRGEGPVR